MTGIVFANIVAKNRGVMSEKVFSVLNRDILLGNLVSRPTRDHLDIVRIYAAMKMDKKRIGDGLTLIMQGDGYEMAKITDLVYPELEKSVIELKEVIGVA
jgi:3-dehydroquinate synthetase